VALLVGAVVVPLGVQPLNVAATIAATTRHHTSTTPADIITFQGLALGIKVLRVKSYRCSPDNAQGPDRLVPIGEITGREGGASAGPARLVFARYGDVQSTLPLVVGRSPKETVTTSSVLVSSRSTMVLSGSAVMVNR
jgi:hypothetical protein